MKIITTLSLYIALVGAGLISGVLFSQNYGCINTGGEFVTKMCVDKDYTNDVRFSFTGGATEVFWSFGFKNDTPRDTILRILDSVN